MISKPIFYSILFMQGLLNTTDDFATISGHLVLFSAACNFWWLLISRHSLLFCNSVTALKVCDQHAHTKMDVTKGGGWGEH